MSKHRSPSNFRSARSLPHDHARDNRQPYAKELEDYACGVVNPPEEQVGKRPNDRKAGKTQTERE